MLATSYLGVSRPGQVHRHVHPQPPFGHRLCCTWRYSRIGAFCRCLESVYRERVSITAWSLASSADVQVEPLEEPGQGEGRSVWSYLVRLTSSALGCANPRFIPAALTARPWDFGEETLRDRNENHEISINPPEPPEEAIVRVSGPKGEAEGVVLGVGRGLGIGNVEATPSHPTSPGAPATRDPSQTIGPGWKKKAPIPAPHAHTQVICDEHRSMHTGAVNPSPLAHTLASVDEGQSQPSSANSSAVSTPEIEVWVKPAETKRSPSILSTSRFKRSKQKAKPPPIDPSKANAPIDSPLDSPAASSIPTPSDTASTPKPTPPSPRPATDTSLVTLADHFVSDTLCLLKGTLGRKGGRPARNIPWHHKHGDEKKEGMTGSLAQESGAKKGIRHGRSLFELRRFYNRSM